MSSRNRSPRDALARCLALARAGRRAEARRVLDERPAGARGPRAGIAELAAAELEVGLGRPECALARFEAAAALEPRLSRRAFLSRSEVAGRYGWTHEELASLGFLLGAAGALALHRRLIRRLAHAGAHREAIQAIERALGRFPEARDLRLARIEQGLAAGEAGERHRAALRELGAQPDPAVAQLWIEAGRVEEAERLAAAAGPQPWALALRAEIALWRLDLDAVITIAEQLPPAVAARFRGAAALLAGDPAEALRCLEPAPPEDALAWHWRGEALCALGRDEEARQALGRAVSRAGGYLFPARLLHQLIEARNRSDRVPHRYSEELDAGLGQLLPADQLEELRQEGGASRLAAARAVAFEALGGSRGRRLVRRSPAGPSVLPPLKEPRSAARAALDLIRVLPPERVFAAFDEVIAAFPDSSMPVVHRGELWLWLGDYQRARADFDRTLEINRTTRWGYLGHMACDVVEGRLDRALDWGRRSVEAMGDEVGSLFIYRGEARRLQGDLVGARSDLTAARRSQPTRLGTYLNLALLCHAEGDEPGLRRWSQALFANAPAFYAELRLALGLPPDPPLGVDALGRLHAEGLRWMQGNRSSSCVTWLHPRHQRLRLIPRPRPGLEGGPSGPTAEQIAGEALVRAAGLIESLSR